MKTCPTNTFTLSHSSGAGRARVVGCYKSARAAQTAMGRMFRRSKRKAMTFRIFPPRRS